MARHRKTENSAKQVHAAMGKPPPSWGVFMDGSGGDFSGFLELGDWGGQCCAERNLLRELDLAATRHGVSPHSRVAWIRRKYGSDMVVWRVRKDGSPGCSVPCALCAKEMARMGLRVHACTQGGAWFHDLGALRDPPETEERQTSRGRVRLRYLTVLLDGLFAPSPNAAGEASAAWLAALSACVLAIFVAPASIVMALLAGPNLRTAAVSVPLSGYLADWTATSYGSLPALIRVTLEATVGSLVSVVATIIAPASFAAWASLAALTASVSSAYWAVRRRFVAGHRVSLGFMVVHTLCITAICMAVVQLLIRLAPWFATMLVSGIGAADYMGCVLFGGCFAAVYIVATPDTQTEQQQDLETAQIEVASIATSVCALVCMLVERFS